MAVTTKFVLPVAFTNPDLPILQESDPILSPNGGSLLLVDYANHPDVPSGWQVGVPANNGLAYNIAWEQAQDTIGSGTEATLAAPWYASPGLVTPDTAKVRAERTSKGGVHVYTRKQTDPGSEGMFLNLPSPHPIWTFMKNNTGADSGDVKHKFYISTWYRVTRSRRDTIDGATVVNHRGAMQEWQLDGIPPSVNYVMRNNDPDPAIAAGTQFTDGNAEPALGSANVLSSGTLGYRTGGTNFQTLIPATLGPLGTWYYLDTQRRGAPDRIFYRAYIEDLTVSGRTYAEVRALDVARFNLDNGVGGRINGDTYTDPSTVFPASA